MVVPKYFQFCLKRVSANIMHKHMISISSQHHVLLFCFSICFTLWGETHVIMIVANESVAVASID